MMAVKLCSTRWTCMTATIFLLGILALFSAEKPAGSALSKDIGYTPYRVGEVLSYSVSWSRFMVAAKMITEVRKRGILNNQDSYHVVMKAETSGLADAVYGASSRYESYVDAGTLLPHWAQNSLKQPKREKKRNYRLEPQFDRVVLFDGRTIPIPPSTYDVASLFYAIRSIDLARNKPANFNLLENDKVQKLVAEVEGFEVIKTDAGSFKTARIAVKLDNKGVVSDSRKIRLYLSNDSKRQPVLITVDLPLGSIRIELDSAR